MLFYLLGNYSLEPMEARKYAARDHRDGDWFKDCASIDLNKEDMTNKCQTPNTNFTPTKKVLGLKLSEDWYVQNSEPSSPCCGTPRSQQESKSNRQKIQGVGESWFRHDGHPVGEERRSETPTTPLKDSKNRQFNPNSNDWFQHEHQEVDLNDGMNNEDVCNEASMFDLEDLKSGDSPNVFASSHNLEGNLKSPHRVIGKDAEDNQRRDRDNSAVEWLTSVAHSPMPGNNNSNYVFRRADTEEFATRQRQESDNWFDYESNQKWQTPTKSHPRCNSPIAQSNRERFAGGEMRQILTFSDSKTTKDSKSRNQNCQ